MDAGPQGRRPFWTGRLDNIGQAFAKRGLRGFTFQRVRVKAHSPVKALPRTDRDCNYPSQQSPVPSLSGYTWNAQDVNMNTLLVSEELHCAGGRCTSLGTAKYPRCAVSLRIEHYLTESHVYLNNDHGLNLEEEGDESPPPPPPPTWGLRPTV